MHRRLEIGDLAGHLRTVGGQLGADGIEKRAELAELVVLSQVEAHAQFAPSKAGQPAANHVNRPQQQLRQQHRADDRDGEREARGDDRRAKRRIEIFPNEQRGYAHTDRAEVGVAKPQVAKATVPQLDPGMAARHPLRILLAEDNVVNQKLAMRLLQQMGYRADLASNGIEAVESVERQAYDVVLMDVQMPELDGLDATRRIRALGPAHDGLRIVAMTANAMQGDQEMCMEAGMDDYLTKPIRVERLVEALQAVTSREAR